MKLALIIALLISVVHASSGIPLPNQSIAQNNGLVVGMGFGTLKYTGCKTLWTWTAQGSYSYNSFISSGPKIKFLGGHLDSKNNIINQKYTAYANFMHNQQRYAAFIGPVASIEIIDLKATKENTSYTNCGDLFAESDFSAGYQSGMGVLITQNWGISFGHTMDWMLNGIYTASFSAAIAFNLREQFEKFIVNTNNFWIFIEYSPTFIKKNIGNISHHVIIGGAIGF